MTDMHAKHAPSAMYLTVACPGWQKQASLTPPAGETEESREGDAGHEVAAICAAGGITPPPVGSFASNDVEITEEMYDGAALWVEALEGYPAHIETPVQIQRIHPTDCWGTPDARQWAPETLILRAADYKFGHGFVDEFENWQLLAYMIGMIDELKLWERTDITLEMTIVQPRYYNGKPIRTWSINIMQIWPYVERMQAAVREAESDSPRVISGTHCTYCPARGTCDVYRKTNAGLIDFAGLADPMMSAPADIGHELRIVQQAIKRLEARETGLAALAEVMIRQGQRVPHFALEQSVGRLTWTVPIEVVEMTARMRGKSIMAPAKPITPTQARDRKILDATVISEYSERPMGAFKLVPASTKPRSFKT
jgi:hypothetical protein